MRDTSNTLPTPAPPWRYVLFLLVPVALVAWIAICNIGLRVLAWLADYPIEPEKLFGGSIMAAIVIGILSVAAYSIWQS